MSIILVIKVGPIECIQFAIDEHELCENFAWVIFKHSISVEDSIKLFRGTKLYGLPIVTKYYSKHLDDPVFHDQLDYFKQLVNVEQNSQSNDNSNNSRWIDRSSDNMNNIPDSLPEPPVYDVHYNINRDNYDSRSNAMSRHGYKDKSSKYQHNKPNTKCHNSAYRNEHNSIEKSYNTHGHYRKSEHNNRSGSMEVSSFDRDSSLQNDDRKHRGIHTSSNWQESSYHNQEPSFKNDKNAAKDELPIRDLRDIVNYRKHISSDYDNHDDSNDNAAYTPIFDLRDTINHCKSSRYEDPGKFELNTNNQWSGKSHKNLHSSLTDLESRKNNYFSERYNDSNARHKNHADYNNKSYYQDKSSDNYQEYDNSYPNNYNDSYRRDKNRPNNYKNNQMRAQNMETSNRQNSSYHPYNRNDERKEYRNLYDERSGHNHGRSYNRGGSDRSKQNYYS